MFWLGAAERVDAAVGRRIFGAHQRPQSQIAFRRERTSIGSSCPPLTPHEADAIFYKLLGNLEWFPLRGGVDHIFIFSDQGL